MGQNFAKAFDVTFQSSEGKLEHVYATSWGVSTRLIGTLIMAHSDDKGLLLPPRLAPVQVVIIPMGRDDDARAATIAAAEDLAAKLKAAGCFELPMRVHIDKREKESPGYKFNDWELHGACVRIELGPRELESGSCVMARRDTGEKTTLPLGDETVAAVADCLRNQQAGLFSRALEMREANMHRIDDWSTFESHFAGEGGAGFVLAHWDGTSETEAKISEATKATIRCIPLEPLHADDAKPGVCVLTGKPSAQRVLFAKAY